jgi:hypothetical protein
MANNVVLSNPSIVVNNVSVGVIPNSISFTEGLGEQQIRTYSSGGGNVQTAYVQNLETAYSMVKFSLLPTDENIALARGWKTNGANNVVTMSDVNFTRTFLQAALLNNYEVNTSADGNIDLEFTALTAV